MNYDGVADGQAFTKRADEKNYTNKPENKHFGII